MRFKPSVNSSIGYVVRSATVTELVTGSIPVDDITRKRHFGRDNLVKYRRVLGVRLSRGPTG